MAFLDAGLRSGVLQRPEEFVEVLRETEVRIGVPEEACVTGTIQKIRQEPKKPTAEQPYISNIALREVVFLRGVLAVAFSDCDHRDLISAVAPLVNYFGKRGSFFQFEGSDALGELDTTFTVDITKSGKLPVRCHLETLDDFGPQANFDALNSYSGTPIKRGMHRTWIESAIPLGVYNVGAGFVHYKR